MRAGLFSEIDVVQRLNESLVCTWILQADATALAASGDLFGKTLAGNWDYPLDVMFLKPDGSFLHKLNAFEDLHTTQDHNPSNTKTLLRAVDQAIVAAKKKEGESDDKNSQADN